MAHFASNGKFIWAKNIASAGIPYEFSLQSDGNIGFSIIINGVDSATVYRNTYQSNKVEFSVFGKIDKNGNEIWSKATDIGYTLSERMLVFSFKEFLGSYYLYGSVGKNGSYNGDTLYTNGPSIEPFIMKIDRNLKMDWFTVVKSTYPAGGSNFKIDSKGNAFMTGRALGPMTFGSNTITSTGRSDSYFLAYNLSNKTWLSYEMLNTTGDNNDLIHDLVIDNEDNVILAGKYEGWLYFDPNGPNKDTLFMKGGNSNAVVLKYGTNKCPTPQPKDTSDTSDTISVYETFKLFTRGFTLYPNPAQHQVTISTTEKLENAHIEVYSVTGELLQSHKLNNSQSQTLDITGYKPGLYLVEMINNNTRWVEKLVVE